MRIRKSFAAAFVGLLFISGYLGLSTTRIPSIGQSDKGLHFITFFLLSITFYWIFETTRRRVLNFTLFTCTFFLAICSELLQDYLPNGRDFDPLDIVANMIGSLAAIGLSAWYHKRMLERKRAQKGYHGVGEGEEVVEDLELGEGTGPQETGIVSTGGQRQTNVDEELENWDENAEDEWDDGEGETQGKDQLQDAESKRS